MRVLRGDLTTWEPLEAPTFLTIGVFDGVHLGHQSILTALRQRAQTEAVGVLTFNEHPAAVLRPNDAPPMLTTLPQRLDLLERYGADVTAVLEFDQVRWMQPAAFVSTVVSGMMRGIHVAVGKGFRFGHRMSGDEHVLRQLGAEFGFSVEVIDIMGGDVPVSSTAIRDALSRGEVAAAAQMLGRPFQVRGAVVVGDHRGRSLGFPTANLEIKPGRAVPRDGVYSALTKTADGTWRPSVVNIGVRPTFGGLRRVIEVHLLDDNMELYGQELHVDFVSWIRPERRFDGIDDLVEQIERDVATARLHLAAQPP